jgi:hypothetical protein
MIRRLINNIPVVETIEPVISGDEGMVYARYFEPCECVRESRMALDPALVNRTLLRGSGPSGFDRGESDLVAQLRRGQWDNIVTQGPNPTGFCTVDHPAPRLAADLIEVLYEALYELTDHFAFGVKGTSKAYAALAKARGEA